MKLYTYYCADGFVRTRCRRHIVLRGKRAALKPQWALVDVREAQWFECYECMALARTLSIRGNRGQGQLRETETVTQTDED